MAREGAEARGRARVGLDRGRLLDGVSGAERGIIQKIQAMRHILAHKILQVLLVRPAVVVALAREDRAVGLEGPRQKRVVRQQLHGALTSLLVQVIVEEDGGLLGRVLLDVLLLLLAHEHLLHAGCARCRRHVVHFLCLQIFRVVKRTLQEARHLARLKGRDGLRASDGIVASGIA